VLPVLVTIPVTSIFVMFICLHIHRTAGSYLGVTKILCWSALCAWKSDFWTSSVV